MSRTIQPPTMHTKLVAASISDMVQEWYQGKCEVPPMQADTFEQRISRFQSDLPQAAGMVASVGREIRALITQRDHDALAAHVAAEVAKARAEWVGTHCKELTAADRAHITAHLSYELQPVGKPPTWNQLAMEVVRLSNALTQIGAKP